MKNEAIPIYEVEEVSTKILEKLPPILEVYAKGTTRTGGYTNPQLIPRIYVTPPSDGIWEFDFNAVPPSGPAIEMISPIEATYKWDDYPQDMKGVRVYSETNNIESQL